MKTLPIALAALTLLPSILPAAEPPRACSVRELDRIRLSTDQSTEQLLVTGTVQSAINRAFTLSDATDYTRITCLDFALPSPGTVVAVHCAKAPYSSRDKGIDCTKWTAIGSAPVQPPLDLRLDELDEHRHDLHTVTVEGSVVNIVPDEIDSRYRILLLKDGAMTLPCFIRQEQAAQRLQDARVRLTGIYYRLANVLRRFSGPFIDVSSGITVLRPAPADLLDAPAIDPRDYVTPREAAAMSRRSLVGTVLATWNGNQAMLRSGEMIVGLTFARDSSLPPCGTSVRVSGYPGTDLYRLILSNCVWAPSDTPPDETDEPLDISPRQILLNGSQTPQFKCEHHGRLIRLRGIVRALPSEYSANRRLLVEADGFRVPVDFSSNPSAANGISPGCKIEATGRCLMEISGGKPYEVFPQISGVAVVLRSPADLRVLAHPPWWTPRKLLIVIAALLAALVGIFLWNRFLNRIVERRGRQLLRAEIDRACSDFRVNERTHLAVELHDTISQNLTGVALELNIAGRKAPTNLPVALEHLGLAQRSLASCRQELRNCLWDLRSNALGVASMDEAIRQTLAPNVGNAKLAVRFAVPREHITDNTAHAILRIIRELTVNAIRHGGAKSVRIAGSVENGKLLFSVADDGSGFDPAAAPGVPEGHFGLQGIRERVKMFGGSFEIVHRHDGGMRAVVRLPVPQKPKPKGSIA